MLLNQLRSLVKSGVTEYGGYIYVITTKSLPRICTDTITSVKQCPTGLTKLKVVEMNHKYIEKYTFGCGGDQEHQMERRNGVLVEVEWGDRFIGEGESVEDAVKRINALDLHTVVYANKVPSGVQIVVSHKVLIVPWGEYVLVEAEREKKEVENKERWAALNAIGQALRLPQNIDAAPYVNGVTFKDSFYGDRKEKRGDDFRDENDQLRYDQETEERKRVAAGADFTYKGERWRGEMGTYYLYGEISMSMSHAALLANGLDLLRRAHESGQLNNLSLFPEFEQFFDSLGKIRVNDEE